MELGNMIYTNRGDLPQLEVITTWNDEEQGAKTRTYYLSPFRGYRFQVSGTKDGQGDYGSSEVLGLGNILLATLQVARPNSNSSIFASNSAYYNGNAAKAIYRELALSALYQHARHEDKPYSPSFEDREKLDWFVDKVYEFIANAVMMEQSKAAIEKREKEEKETIVDKGSQLMKDITNEINSNVQKMKQYTGKLKLPKRNK